jgi:DNA-binding Lrp family transcriptional regulator
MKQASHSETTNRIEVKDLGQARLLSDPESFRYFSPFLARDFTVSQAAKELDCKVDTMLYRVKTLLEAGLLKVVGTETRRGRPIKVYRSSADAYFVPFAVTPFEDIEAAIKTQNQKNGDIIAHHLARVVRQSGRDGRHIFRDIHGEVSVNSGANANDVVLDLDDLPEIARRVYAYEYVIGESASDELELTDEDAKEFILEFYKFWRGYKNKKSSKKPQKYFLQFSFVPIDE